jgi:uncharacterized phage protein (TIGR01671 family)
MNRQLKFRARDTKNNKWLDSVPSMEYLLDDGDHSISHHDIDDESSIYIYPKNLLGDTFDSRIVWQQYTGLKDKNGKEIYEGDIVKHRKHNKEVRIGEFSDGVDERTGVFLQDPKIKHINFGTNRLSSFSSCEIIGNIFENPELIKNK